MNSQRWMSQNFFAFFFTWGIFLPYWTGWLVEGKGLSVPEASIIMGFGLIIRGISTMVTYPFASKLWAQQTVLILLTVGSLITSLLYIPSSSMVPLFVVTLIFSAIYPSLLPAMESLGSTLAQVEGIHYGKSRSYGSLGYIIAVLVISFLTGYFNEQAILWTMIVGLVIMVIHRFFPAPSTVTTKLEADNKEAPTLRGLWKIKSFPIMILVVFLLQGAHSSYYNYGFIYLQDLGVNNYYIGIILNIAVLFEIIYFAKADHLFTNWKPSSLLLLASIGSSIRWILLYIPNMWIYIFSQSLHALSFGVAHYAFIRYITTNLPPQQISNAQGLYSALAMSFSTAILTFIGGFLYEVNPGLSFLGMLICTIPAIIIILVTREKYNY